MSACPQPRCVLFFLLFSGFSFCTRLDNVVPTASWYRCPFAGTEHPLLVLPTLLCLATHVSVSFVLSLCGLWTLFQALI